MGLLAVFAVSGLLFWQVWDTLAGSYDPLNRGDKSKKRDEKVTIDDPFTVLLIGTDVKKASDTNWRPDVLMIASVNPKKKSMKMISVPRDTYAEIANTNGMKNKINSAAYYGEQKGVGPTTNTVETVEDFFNIPIDYYAKINFTGFMDVVDAAGGITVHNKRNFSIRLFNKMEYYEPGELELDGRRALGYVRERKSDPKGDQGRNERQREVLQAVMNKMMSVKSIGKIDDVLKSVGDNVTYSFKVSDLPALQATYSEISKENTENIEIQGENSRNNPQNLWFFYVEDTERLRISHILQKHLGLPLETLEGEPFTGTSPADEDPNTGEEGATPGEGETSPDGTSSTENGTQTPSYTQP
ncbi:LCP family protein [Kroppenstedtia pulmonis]|uniref:LCP family glycopolymer transferase n=1 Tax=Kroppenstedtia pulmonis TaxID=1380685 RepID=UPI001FECC6AE|nr:LCP family protein [Kroppenstedtia pulmonis]